MAMAVAAYILISLGLMIAGYLAGDIKASREWKAAYTDLYKMAVKEIIAARSGVGADSKEILEKLQALQDPTFKPTPKLRVIKKDKE